MIFSPDLAEKVVAGRKTVTRRPANGKPCAHRVGNLEKLQPGQGQPALPGRILIRSISLEPLGKITGVDAVREGYPHERARQRFLDSFSIRYPISLSALVYRIEFEYVAPS